MTAPADPAAASNDAASPPGERVWRKRKRGKAHRVSDKGYDTACGHSIPPSEWESVPLAQTAPEDRCRTCWPVPPARPGASS